MSVGNVTCAYCDHSFDYHPDEPVKQDERVELGCPKCAMNFTALAVYSLDFIYEAQATCLNGDPHLMKRCNTHLEEYYPEWVRCAHCGKENRGPYRGKS